MLILGNKKLRQTKVLVVKLGGLVVKIPFSFGSFKEIKLEKEKIEQVKNDCYFSKYLLLYKKCFACLVTVYANPMPAGSDGRNLIGQYFSQAFAGCDQWPGLALSELVNPAFSAFVKKYLIEDYNDWLDYLNNSRLPAASAHGDFCPDNVLTAGGRLYFIDWSRYAEFSSRYFDLIDYHLFLNKDSGQSWTKKWQEELSLNREEIFEIKVKRTFWPAYAVWKAGQELAILKLRGKLNQQKINKYFHFIKTIKQLT